MSVRDDAIGWRPDEARRTCAAIPDCRVEEVAGTGHISPLLIDRDRIVQLIRETVFQQQKCEVEACWNTVSAATALAREGHHVLDSGVVVEAVHRQVLAVTR